MSNAGGGMTLPFGKFQGRPVEEVPAGYVGGSTPAMRAVIEAHAWLKEAVGA